MIICFLHYWHIFLSSEYFIKFNELLYACNIWNNDWTWTMKTSTTNQINWVCEHLQALKQKWFDHILIIWPSEVMIHTLHITMFYFYNNNPFNKKNIVLGIWTKLLILINISSSVNKQTFNVFSLSELYTPRNRNNFMISTIEWDITGNVYNSTY